MQLLRLIVQGSKDISSRVWRIDGGGERFRSGPMKWSVVLDYKPDSAGPSRHQRWRMLRQVDNLDLGVRMASQLASRAIASSRERRSIGGAWRAVVLENRGDSTALSLAAFDTFTAIGPICGCAITPRVVGHPLFDLHLELLRLFHERVERCEHRRKFFGCEFGHDADCNERVSFALLSLAVYGTNHHATHCGQALIELERLRKHCHSVKLASPLLVESQFR